MKILTPSGYKEIAGCSVGDEVSAFDIATGAPLVNTIETLQWVDATEWARWWHAEPVVPPFQFYKINDTWTLNSEQSIWRNGTNVCHAKHLVVGDVLHDGDDNDLTITSIEEVTADGWWRFDISGDHSYIVDGLTLHNASRFWVLGTASVTPANTASWSATTGGAGGQTVPGAADTVAFDGSSGGGTVTMNFGGTWTIQSLTTTAFTGTWDNSVNNNNVATSATSGFTSAGSATRTLKLGTATYTLNNGGYFLASAGLTYTGNTGANIVLTGANVSRTFQGAGLSHGNVTFASSVAGASYYNITGANTFASLSITGSSNPQFLKFPASTTNTISAAFTWTGTSSAPFTITSDDTGITSTIAAASGSVGTYNAIRNMVFTGNTPVFSNSFDLGGNTGATITPPSASGGGVGVIGS